jgi:phage tail-like protein
MMSRYRFASAAQWGAGLVSAADAHFNSTLTPAPGWARGPQRWAMLAGAAALAGNGEAFWIGSTEASAAPRLHRLADDDRSPDTKLPPAQLAAARHLVAGRRQLWSADERPQLHAWLRDGLSLRLQAALPVDAVIDLAADGDDGVWVLARDGSHEAVLHVDCAGHVVARLELAGCRPRGLASLGRGGDLVLLDASGERLTWIDSRSGLPRFSLGLHAARLCADAGVISAGRGQIAVGGVSHAPDGTAWVATFDAAGSLIDVIDIDDAPVDVAIGRGVLLVTTRCAALRFRRDGTMAARDAQVLFVTPALESPPAEGRNLWLRAEATAALPTGTSLELSWAGTDDGEKRRRADAILRDATLPPRARWERLRTELAFESPLVFSTEGAAADGPAVCALPLHDARPRWIWIAVTLVATPGSSRPELHSLDVLYPDDSLMQQLPSIYRRQAAQPNDFLRSLVGLLETTTQGLDRRIATLGQLLDPARAEAPWLDAAAEWLGIPWDEALPLEAKRALLSIAELLQSARGTRSGLEALLAAVLPPGRARVIDAFVENGFARLGCPGAGTRLPALLGGLEPGWLVLGRKARLGRGRLSADGVIDCGARFAGIVVVEVAATSAERRDWSWLRPLLEQVMPLTARLRLRWTALHGARAGDVLHAELRLEADPAARLGEASIVGSMRLTDHATPPLDTAGPTPGFRLH